VPISKSIQLILHNIRSAYNVGSIFRTADAAGVNKIYLCGYTPTPAERKVAKTALGAEQIVPWEQHKQSGRLLKQLRADGIWLIALEQAGKSENLFQYKPPKNKSVAIIVGHERRGLSKKVLAHADAMVEIPMHGKKESLNVSVAVGIALYQILNFKF